MKKQTPEGRRERARLRSKRWRRAHGIGPRKPPERPWLAEGVSRSHGIGGSGKPVSLRLWPLKPRDAARILPVPKPSPPAASRDGPGRAVPCGNGGDYRGIGGVKYLLKPGFQQCPDPLRLRSEFWGL
jgi:hypothetical protein